LQWIIPLTLSSMPADLCFVCLHLLSTMDKLCAVGSYCSYHRLTAVSVFTVHITCEVSIINIK